MVTQLPLFCFISLVSVILYSVASNFLTKRSEEVFCYYMHIAGQTISASMYDALQGKSSGWRMAALKSVSCRRMLYQFWKPLDSFYPDRRFIDPRQTEDPSLDDLF